MDVSGWGLNGWEAALVAGALAFHLAVFLVRSWRIERKRRELERELLESDRRVRKLLEGLEPKNGEGGPEKRKAAPQATPFGEPPFQDE